MNQPGADLTGPAILGPLGPKDHFAHVEPRDELPDVFTLQEGGKTAFRDPEREVVPGPGIEVSAVSHDTRLGRVAQLRCQLCIVILVGDSARRILCTRFRSDPTSCDTLPQS